MKPRPINNSKWPKQTRTLNVKEYTFSKVLPHSGCRCRIQVKALMNLGAKIIFTRLSVQQKV